MAFDVPAFQKKYRELIAQNKELKVKVAGWAGDKAKAIDTAVMSAVTPLRNRITEFKAELADRNQRLAATSAIRAELEATVARLNATIDEQNAFMRSLEETNIQLARRSSAAEEALTKKTLERETVVVAAKDVATMPAEVLAAAAADTKPHGPKTK